MPVRTTTPLGRGAERRRAINGHWGVPRDRNDKARIAHHARTMLRATERGRHYGRLTAKHLAVLMALLWRFHDSRTGRCFPSHEAIAAAAGCARSTVQLAIRALEGAGILTWVRRWSRARVDARDAAGAPVRAVMVVRDSNAYAFAMPPASAGARPTNGPGGRAAELRPLVRPRLTTDLRSGSEVPSTKSPSGVIPGPSATGARGEPAPSLADALGGAIARMAAAREAARARGRVG